ncbi:MAG: cation:proton antiporter [Anaerolineae bacterium]|nr:cation:proton antiporter [Anaerolineae bacterium]MCA9891587.1 cation:proton antiporter [Anaerolineae bacterium]
MLILPPIISHSIGFFLIALAAKQIGKFFSRYGLPYITGYLGAGVLAGPFILELLPKEAVESLRYIDDVSLAIIAFVAGSELYLKEIRARLRGILLNATGIVIAAFILIGIALFILQSFIPFTADYPFITKAAVSLLGATILLALSPASTIAVIQEARAKGPFSTTVLSITVVMDVVIIIFFAVSVAFASAMIDNEPVTISFLIILAVDIVIALVAGYFIGRVIAAMLSASLTKIMKAVLLLALGYLLFESANHVPGWIYDAIGVKIKIEPLLMSMVAGFTVTNFTRFRQPFEDLLHDISPAVYVAFFALTGIGLKLDILISTIGIAAILFGVRMVAIIIGTYVGGLIAGEPQNFRRYAGLGLITQAGIALGLARETAVFFPDTLGSDFATLIIAVIVLNEVFGPMLLKYALRQVGEAYVPESSRGEPRRLLILGIEPQSMTLARQMASRGWQVVVADTDAERVEALAAEDVDERAIPHIDRQTLSPLLKNEHDALVVLMDDDDASLRACMLARDEFGVTNLVVRLRDVARWDEFIEAGIRVIDPASAIVYLLEQSINAPEVVDLLLHQDPDHDVSQIEITEKSIDNLPLRDLRLPTDVLILEIMRDGQTIVPHGFSSVRLGDKVTVIGSPNSLTKVMLKLSP